jgi:hypothetical protein
MTTIVSLVALALLVLLIYACARDGAFVSIYVLLRNLLAFMVAMTLMEPLASLVMLIAPEQHPWPLYYRVVAFAGVFGAVFATARWLKIEHTPGAVSAITLVDRIAGGICGAVNWIVVIGVLLILWSLLPFVKFIPGDFGRLETDSGLLFPGKAMLRFYGFTAGRMSGGRTFLVEDEELLADVNGNGAFDKGDQFRDANNNGLWDRGWLWRYKNHADFHFEDIELAVPDLGAEEEPDVPAGRR